MDVAKQQDRLMTDRLIEYLFSLWNEVASNLMVSFAGAIVTWIFNPRPKFWHNFSIMVGSLILGTTIGYSIDHSDIRFLISIKYGIITLFGMYALKLYTFLGEKMRNPLAFIREVKHTINLEAGNSDDTEGGTRFDSNNEEDDKKKTKR